MMKAQIVELNLTRWTIPSFSTIILCPWLKLVGFKCRTYHLQPVLFQIYAMASIFLAAKIEEYPRRIRDVINVFHHIKQKRNGR